MSTLTRTVPLAQHPTEAAREAGLAVINRCMPVFATGVHGLALPELEHEAERLEGLPTSPVIKSMRAIVETELAAKRAVTSC